MKKPANPLDRVKGLTNAVLRFPLSAALLLTFAAVLAVSIQTNRDYEALLLSCAVGVFLSAVLQAAHERFSRRPSARFFLYGCGAVLTLGYYLLIRQIPKDTGELWIRSAVALFALFFAFLWVPVIKSKVTFNESFMAAFKAVFHCLLYAAVLFGGCSLVAAAVNTLIVHVSYKAYPHIANIVFVLFAPLFFLSLIPVYPGRQDETADAEALAAREERVNKAVSCPRFLEVLVSYIIIPLTAVFSAILILYIALNIKGEFWTNNLLEPLLVSYAVAVILGYLLSSRLDNRFARLFRMIFPKVLVPIVLFQVTASVLRLRDAGITHGRYFVILFGIFAACAGFVMSIVPVRKNGIIAALLIVCSAVSILPPADAFTLSRRSQEKRLEAVLTKNGMLQNNRITPNGTVSDRDKEIITASAEYLARLGYTDSIEWMPRQFVIYHDFYKTFGFDRHDQPEPAGRWISVSVDASQPVDIAGYDLLTRVGISEGQTDFKLCSLDHLGSRYTLRRERAGDMADIVLTDGKGGEVIRFHIDDIFARYAGFTAEKSELSMEDATFSAENDRVKLTLIVQNANMQSSDAAVDDSYYYVDFYALIRFQ